MTRPRLLLGAALVITALVTGCVSTTDTATSRALAELSTSTSTTTSTSTSTSTSTDTDTDTGRKCESGAVAPKSYRPEGSLPAPGQMPDGSAMRAIQDRAVPALRVGVDENTRYFSSRDDDTDLVGFEPAIAHEIARAIFGDPEKVRFVTVVTDQKTEVLTGEDPIVDLTIDAVSITCDRWMDVDFTTPYYETTQRILVPSHSSISGMADLDGTPVCVTRGSSSEKYLEKNVPEARIVPVEARTDCLVALQEGRADAVLLPYSILYGLWEQDQMTTILGEENLQTQRYGIAIAQHQEDLVRFVNALLAQWRADGTLEKLQQQYLPEKLRTVPVTPPAEYRD